MRLEQKKLRVKMLERSQEFREAFSVCESMFIREIQADLNIGILRIALA